MRFRALATDYDGTLAHDGHVSKETIAAVEQLCASGRQVLLVTGREFPELKSVCPRLDLFDLVVAENGGLLVWPGEDHREELLGPPIPQAFITEMNRLEVKPFSVGRCLFATWRPHEVAVQVTIKRLGIDYHMIFNKESIMVLPNGVTKATGLLAALERLRLGPSEVVGVGDAENDFSFLRICGASAAVSNALPELKKTCSLVMTGDHGKGVRELISEMIENDLQRVASSAPARQASPIAKT